MSWLSNLWDKAKDAAANAATSTIGNALANAIGPVDVPTTDIIQGLPIEGAGANADIQTVYNVTDNGVDNMHLFRVPDWGYQDFIRERTSWQKGFDSSTGEQGWFYFKVFFHFDVKTGLFGSLLNEENLRTATPWPQLGKKKEEKKDESKSDDKWWKWKKDKKQDGSNEPAAPEPEAPTTYGDSAYRYLMSNVSHYTNVDMFGKIRGLRRFAATLSFINSHAPWFFDSVGGLDKAATPDFNNPLSPDNIIELGFAPDAIDMRVTTLLDLYRYSVYDYVGLKEIVPQNLREFTMSIVLFHTPLRWYHTGMQTMRRGTFPYKTLNAENMQDRMTYKLFTFKGCEFVTKSFGSVYPTEISNKEPFNLAGNKIQIHYKRVYQHTFNEWGSFLIGDDGVYYDNDADNNSEPPLRLKAITDAAENPYYFNRGAEVFKPLVDATEAKVNWAMKVINPAAVFGNLYLDLTDVKGEYFKEKLHAFKQGAPSLKINKEVDPHDYGNARR